MSEEYPDTFTLRICTPEREVTVDGVTTALVSGLEGIAEILPGHEPILMPLSIGPMAIQLGPEQSELFAVHGGFLEIGPTGVTILADGAERGDEIDMTRVQEARQRAEERLEQRRDRADDVDFDRARQALLRSIARINAVEQNFLEV